MLSIVNNMQDNFDLNVFHCGLEECSSGHSYGPAVRDHFLIHYVLHGSGLFQVDNAIYHLQAGQGFLICPEYITYYEASRENPWTYSWVGFDGLKAEKYLQMASLTQKEPVFTARHPKTMSSLFERLLSGGTLRKSKEIYQRGIVYEFLAELIENNETSPGSSEGSRKESYVKQAIEYVYKNFSRSVTVRDLATQVGLDRSYLCMLFKEILHMSPQQFITSVRIEKASELMTNRKLTIGDIARSVGYADQPTFSRAFRRERKISPRQFRERLLDS